MVWPNFHLDWLIFSIKTGTAHSLQLWHEIFWLSSNFALCEVRFLYINMNGLTQFSPGLTSFLNNNRNSLLPSITAWKISIIFKFCYLWSSCFRLSWRPDKFKQFSAFISGRFQWIYSSVHPKGCGIGALSCSNQSIDWSVYSDPTFCIARSRWCQRSSFELLWKTERRQVLAFRCFSFSPEFQ